MLSLTLKSKHYNTTYPLFKFPHLRCPYRTFGFVQIPLPWAVPGVLFLLTSSPLCLLFTRNALNLEIFFGWGVWIWSADFGFCWEIGSCWRGWVSSHPFTLFTSSADFEAREDDEASLRAEREGGWKGDEGTHVLPFELFLVVDVEGGWKGEEAACMVLFLVVEAEAGSEALPNIGEDGDASSPLFGDSRVLTGDLKFRW